METETSTCSCMRLAVLLRVVMGARGLSAGEPLIWYLELQPAHD